LANIPLTLLQPGSDARKALSLAGSTATLGSFAATTPAITSRLGSAGSLLKAASPALSVAGPTLGIATGALDVAEGRPASGASQMLQGTQALATSPTATTALGASPGLAAQLATAAPILGIAALGAGMVGTQGESGAPRAGESYGQAFRRAMGGEAATLTGGAANVLFPGSGFVVGPAVAALQATGLFGEHRSLRAKQTAELNEAGRLGDTLRTPIGGYDQAKTLDEFFKVGGAVGYIGSPAEFVKRALSDPASILEASAPGGRWDEPSALGVSTALLRPSVEATVQSAVMNAKRLMQQPGAVEGLAQAEYGAQRRAIQARADQAEQEIRTTYGPHFEANYQNAEWAGGRRTFASPEEYWQASGYLKPAQDLRDTLVTLDQQYAQNPLSVLPADLRATLPTPGGGPNPSAGTSTIPLRQFLAQIPPATDGGGTRPAATSVVPQPEMQGIA